MAATGVHRPQPKQGNAILNEAGVSVRRMRCHNPPAAQTRGKHEEICRSHPCCGAGDPSRRRRARRQHDKHGDCDDHDNNLAACPADGAGKLADGTELGGEPDHGLPEGYPDRLAASRTASLQDAMAMGRTTPHRQKGNRSRPDPRVLNALINIRASSVGARFAAMKSRRSSTSFGNVMCGRGSAALSVYRFLYLGDNHRVDDDTRARHNYGDHDPDI